MHSGDSFKKVYGACACKRWGKGRSISPLSGVVSCGHEKKKKFLLEKPPQGAGKQSNQGERTKHPPPPTADGQQGGRVSVRKVFNLNTCGPEKKGYGERSRPTVLPRRGGRKKRPATVERRTMGKKSVPQGDRSRKGFNGVSRAKKTPGPRKAARKKGQTGKKKRPTASEGKKTTRNGEASLWGRGETRKGVGPSLHTSGPTGRRHARRFRKEKKGWPQKRIKPYGRSRSKKWSQQRPGEREGRRPGVLRVHEPSPQQKGEEMTSMTRNARPLRSSSLAGVTRTKGWLASGGAREHDY